MYSYTVADDFIQSDLQLLYISEVSGATRGWVSSSGTHWRLTVDSKLGLSHQIHVSYPLYVPSPPLKIVG